jgi:hypothetical protein
MDQKEWEVHQILEKALLSIQECISEQDQFWDLDDHLLLQQRTDSTKKKSSDIGKEKRWCKNKNNVILNSNVFL